VGIRFGNGGKGGDANTLFFNAGIGSANPANPMKETDGLFGAIQANANLLSGSPSQRFVEQAYLDLLNRPADAGGLATFSGQVDQGVSRIQVAMGIIASSEFQTDEINKLYQKLLHRQADPGGLSSWLGFLAGGGTILQVEAGILGSAEYFNTRGGGTNMGFLQAVYQDVLGRSLDPAGAQTWGALLSSGTTFTTVAADILNSSESQTDIVNNAFQQFLHRAADPSGLATYTGILQSGGSLEQITADLVGSLE
jgi:hypothetical protein